MTGESDSSKPMPAPRRSRARRYLRITTIVIGVILFTRLDNILWGYLGLPSFNIGSSAILGPVTLYLLAALLYRIVTTKRMPGTIISLLLFFAFQPFFPPPGPPHLLGYSLRLRQKLDIPAVRAWAASYPFPNEAGTAPADGPTFDDIHMPVSYPREFGVAGYRVDIHRSDRTVTISNGGEFMLNYGVTIGPLAREQSATWAWSHGLKLDDDVYVWFEQRPSVSRSPVGKK